MSTPYQPPPGFVGNLTPAQQTALDTLRTEITAEGAFVPERMDDPTLLRCASAAGYARGDAESAV
jgi:hypothetical protein